MKQILYLIFAIIPAALWIYYFVKHDKAQKEPLGLLLLTALIGAAAVIPAGLLETFINNYILPFCFSDGGSFVNIGLSGFIIASFISISVIEEVIKFFSVKLTVYKSKYFNEHADGIVYMVVAAFGFAAAENFLYFCKFGHEIIFLRSLFTPLFHASAAAHAGYYLGRLKLCECQKKNVYKGLLFAIFLHFTYNVLVFSAGAYNNHLFTLLAVVLLIWSGNWMINKFKQTEYEDECLCKKKITK